MCLARTIRYVICAVILFSPFIVLQELSDYSNLPQAVTIQSAALLLLVLWLLKTIRHGEVCSYLPRLNRSILIFIAWAIFSVGWAFNRAEALFTVSHWLACGMIGFFLQSSLDSKEQIRPILGTFFLAAVGVALIGCAQTVFDLKWYPQTIAPAATFANRNIAAQYISLSLPIGLLFFYQASRAYYHGLILTGLFVQILYLYWCQSRTGWLAGISAIAIFSGGILWVGVKPGRRRFIPKTLLMTVITVIITIGLLVIFIPNKLPSQNIGIPNIFKHKVVREGHTVIQDSLFLRLTIWENTLKMIADHPFWGRGPGNFKIFYPNYQQAVAKDPMFSETVQLRAVHNDYLQIFAEMGAVGFVLFIIILGVSIRAAFARVAKAESINDGCLFSALLAVFVVFGIEAFFSFPMEQALPPFVLFVVIALTVKCLPPNQKDKGNCFLIPKKIALLLFFLLLVPVSIALTHNYNRLASDLYYNKMSKSEHQKKWESAIEAGLKAIAYNGRNWNAKASLGRAYIRSGQIDQGIELLKHVIRAYPYHINTHVNLGVAYYRKGENPKALQAFRRALQIKPDYPKALINMGKILMQRKAFKEALVQYQKAFTINPEDYQLNYTIALLKTHIKDYQGAAQAYECILKADPESATAHKMLSYIYLKYLKNFDKAAYHKKQYQIFRLR